MTITATDNGLPPTSASTTFILAVQGQATPPAGLIAWWRGFGDASDAFGASGGTFQNGASSSAGIHTFDGVDDLMFIGQPAALEQANGTWAAWVKPGPIAAGGAAVIMSRWENNDPARCSVILTLYRPGPGPELLVQANVSGGESFDAWRYAISPATVVPGVWTHVAGTFDDASDSLRVFINGVEAASAVQPYPLYHGTGDWRLGFNPHPVVDSSFPGQMSDPMIFDRALSGAELQALAAAGPAAFAVNHPPTLANAIPAPPAVVGSGFSYTVPADTFSDADAGQTLTYSASGLPAWLSFNAATRTFSGTPTAAGSATITVTATDSGTPPLSASTTFTVIASAAPSPLIPLGDLPGGSFQSFAYGVSDDGGVVVGLGTSASGQEAFRWTRSGGMVGLGDLPGGIFESVANGVSGDGSVVVGRGLSIGPAFTQFLP